MEFSREGKHVIRCVISEEEINELGYTMEDIISNSARTQQFMNEIFDMAEEELDTKFELGMKSVRADILPNHTISLTFSELPGTEGVMDHIKDIVNGIMNTIPKQKWDEVNELKNIVLFAFDDLDVLMRYAKYVQMDHIPFSQLYKLDDVYFLMMDISDCDEEEVKRLSILTDEYATDIFAGSEKRAYIYEHGKEIIKNHAIEQLKTI